MNSRKVTESLRSVQDRTSEAYKLQQRHWERLLKGHTAPVMKKKRGKERKNGNDPGTDSV